MDEKDKVIQLLFKNINELQDYCLKLNLDFNQADEALRRLEQQLPRCLARTKSHFINWCKKRLNQIAVNIRAEDGAITLREAAEATRRPDCKPLEFVENNGCLLINVDGKYVWKLPAEHRLYADVVWPVFVKTFRGKPYLMKSVNGNKRFVHPHYMQTYKSVSLASRITAANGDMLDFTADNLRPGGWNKHNQQEFEKRLKQSKNIEALANNKLVSKPAKATPVRRYETNSDDVHDFAAFRRLETIKNK